MPLISRFLLTVLLSFAIAGSPLGVSATPAGLPALTTVASQAHAGVRGLVLAYAVKKAVEFGGRAVFRTLVQAASNPKTRAAVFREISEYARKNPKFAGRANALRENIYSELNLLARANRAPYSPRTWGDKLAKAHGKDMKSPTLPEMRKPNVKMAGKSVQIGKDRVPFNERGFQSSTGFRHTTHGFRTIIRPLAERSICGKLPET